MMRATAHLFDLTIVPIPYSLSPIPYPLNRSAIPRSPRPRRDNLSKGVKNCEKTLKSKVPRTQRTQLRIQIKALTTKGLFVAISLL
jgi:hypothetical protein